MKLGPGQSVHSAAAVAVAATVVAVAPVVEEDLAGSRGILQK
jgi:hypothetical protein